MLKIRMHHSKRKGAGTLIKEVLAYSSRCCAWRLQPIVALESAYWLGCGGCLASIGRGLLSLRSIRPFSPHSQQNTRQSAGPQQENPAELRGCVMCVCVCSECQEERETVWTSCFWTTAGALNLGLSQILKERKRIHWKKDVYLVPQIWRLISAVHQRIKLEAKDRKVSRRIDFNRLAEEGDYIPWQFALRRWRLGEDFFPSFFPFFFCFS